MHRRPVPLLVAAGVASAALLLALGADVAFMYEDWELLLHRRGFTFDAFLEPINEHLVFLPAAMYKGLQAGVGMDSELPFHLMAVSLLLLCAGLLFVYLRRCVGDWLALLGTVLVLFLGSAWEILLWPLTLSFSGSTAAGVGALLALQREDRRGDVAACVALIVSIAFMSLGVLFAVAAATGIALRGERRLARAYVVAVPLLLYGLWFVGWGRDVESAFSLDNVVAAPGFMLEGIASSVGALLGLFALQPHVGDLARVVGAVAVVLGAGAAIAWLASQGRLSLRQRDRSPWLWAAVVLFFGFWLITALNDVPWRTPSQSRYMYTGAVLLLLLLAEWFRGVRLGGREMVALCAVGALALAGNLVALRDGHRVLEQEGELIRAQLGALEIARDHVDPAFQPASVPAASRALFNLDAGSYFSASEAYGSPADDPQELGARPEATRAAVDLVLAQALRLTLEPSPGEEDRAECARFEAVDREPPAVTRLPSAGAALRAVGEGSAPVRMRRFASGSFPVDLGELDRTEWAVLRLPNDGASEPWELEIPASRAITVCDL